MYTHIEIPNFVIPFESYPPRELYWNYVNAAFATGLPQAPTTEVDDINYIGLKHGYEYTHITIRLK